MFKGWYLYSFLCQVTFSRPPVSGESDRFAKVVQHISTCILVNLMCLCIEIVIPAGFCASPGFCEMLVLFGRIELIDGQIEEIYICVCVYICVHIYMCAVLRP